MSGSTTPRSPSYDPSVENIEHRIPYDPGNADDCILEEDDDARDSDYRPLASQDTDGDDDDDEDYRDNPESGVEIEFELGNEEDGEDDDPEWGDGAGTGGAARVTTAPISISRLQLMQLLGHAGIRRLFATHSLDVDEEEDEDNMEDYTFGFGNRGIRRSPRKSAGSTDHPLFEKVPSAAGQTLMESGTFGTNERREDTIDRRRRKKLAYRLMQRELGLGSYGRQRARAQVMRQNLIPSGEADTIIHYGARCYSGQFSADGNFFFSCAQDFKVRMYDTSNPYDWKYYKVVDNPYGQWTITDASLSRDNKWLAYSSISKIVCLASTDPDNNAEPTMMDFSNTGPGRTRRGGYSHFGIWSIRFSGDGREVVAGTGDYSVYVYDIEREQSILRIPGHKDDVNAVCFASQQSPHILYSGSDDTTLKVWDRRSMSSARPAGVFLGHTEGLTFVDSKGDGRYIVSNGKEQCAKLWDLRKVTATEEAERVPVGRYTTGFDYRNVAYPRDRWRPHPHDCSVVTFRGHQVLKTLIRCHFSPPGSSDSRYVYSGSYDGCVYVWNLDATLAGKIDVGNATRNARVSNRDFLAEADGFFGWSGYQTCVRDASWHPDVPIIAATSWNGWGTSLGTCTTHSWNDGLDEDEGEPKMGRSVDPQLRSVEVEESEEESDLPRIRRARRARMWMGD